MTRKIFIDCGTHLGMGFSKCAEIFNIDHGWEIFGFEANPYVFDGYVKNIESEKYSVLADKNINLVLYQLLLGNIHYLLRQYADHGGFEYMFTCHVRKYKF